MLWSGKDRRDLANGLMFLAPNILGFLAFTLVPLVFSLVLAFSNWDLKRHNMFHPGEHIQMVGLGNFHRLITNPDFYKYLGNTLYFMLGMPFGIAASLIAAILLSKDLHGGGGKNRIWLIAGAVLVTSIAMLVAAGAVGTAMVILITAIAGGFLILGTVAGSSVYRTLFYVPNFISGVATYLLWKKLYNPETGPVNVWLRPPLHVLTHVVNHLPDFLVSGAGRWALAGLAAMVFLLGLRRARRLVLDGDLGESAAGPVVFLLLLPMIVLFASPWTGLGVVLILAILVRLALVRIPAATEPLPHKPWDGLGDAAMYAGVLMTVEFILIGLAMVMMHLPEMARQGLQPPAWLSEYNWAKPALMLMGFWGAIGSQTMLLYIAALTNVPGELYEAADIDGASKFARFWNVTWPQLAPTTFFVVVMGVIGGLQSGFETAKVMTNGGPAGSTTTLSFFIYSEGFATARLGYSSAVAWTMFVLVLGLTMINWTFGNKYVND